MWTRIECEQGRVKVIVPGISRQYLTTPGFRKGNAQRRCGNLSEANIFESDGVKIGLVEDV